MSGTVAVPSREGSNANAAGPNEVRLMIGMQQLPVSAGPPSRLRHFGGTSAMNPETIPAPCFPTRKRPRALPLVRLVEGRNQWESTWLLLAS